MSKDPIQFHDGSANVFADIGVRDPEDALLRAKLMKQIGDVVAEKGLTQSEIAAILKVDQPKVSKLVRGRISGFTSDRLLRYLIALGCDVTIRIKHRPSSRSRGKLVVGAA